MLKYKCNRCGACFNENEADERQCCDDFGHYEGFGHYFEKYSVPICPECDSDDLTELHLDQECTNYDEEFGCQGNCEECPMNGEE